LYAENLRKYSWRLYKNAGEQFSCEDGNFFFPFYLADCSSAVFYVFSIYSLFDEECPPAKRTYQRAFERIAHLAWRIKHNDKPEKIEKFNKEIRILGDQLANR
jgi:hypothetical protein